MGPLGTAIRLVGYPSRNKAEPNDPQKSSRFYRFLMAVFAACQDDLLIYESPRLPSEKLLAIDLPIPVRFHPEDEKFEPVLKGSVKFRTGRGSASCERHRVFWKLDVVEGIWRKECPSTLHSRGLLPASGHTKETTIIFER